MDEIDFDTLGLDIPRPALRRFRIREQLPVGDHDPGLDRVSDELDALPDPELLTDTQLSSTLSKLQELSNRIDAYRDRAAAAAKDAGTARELHAGSTGMFVAIASTHNPGYGSVSARRGEALRRLPGITAAYRAGWISKAHVDEITAACDKILDFAGIETLVAHVAAVLEPAAIRLILAQLVAADQGPQDFETQLERSRRRRGLTITDTGDGVSIRARLDTIQAQILLDALKPGMTTDTGNDTRSRDQKQVDVLLDLIQAGMAATRPSGISSVTVLVDVDDLQTGRGATFEDGTPIPASAFRQFSDQALVFTMFGRRINGQFVPLAVAREKRFATAAQWKALIARDRGCLNCGRHPRHTQAHHIVSWRDGGPTDLSNLTLLCSACHADLHAGYYRIDMINNLPQVTRLRPHRGPP